MALWDRPAGQTTGFGGSNAFGAGPSGQNLFYQPGNTYGADRNWNTTPLAGTIREQNPQLAYTQWAGTQGVADSDSAFNRFVLSQFPKFERAYGLATLQNPLITIDDFLQTMPGIGQLMRQYQMLSPAQRGEEQRTYSPQIRWIGR